jgi:hypothetical protein
MIILLWWKETLFMDQDNNLVDMIFFVRKAFYYVLFGLSGFIPLVLDKIYLLLITDYHKLPPFWVVWNVLFLYLFYLGSRQ